MLGNHNKNKINTVIINHNDKASGRGQEGTAKSNPTCDLVDYLCTSGLGGEGFGSGTAHSGSLVSK